VFSRDGLEPKAVCSSACLTGIRLYGLIDRVTTPDRRVSEGSLALPAKSPELNPTENIWQFMRDNWLSNPIFRSYDDILDHCCHAWNKLVDQPWTIMSIGMRDWAHRSSSTLVKVRMPA
jgi:putative transposase